MSRTDTLEANPLIPKGKKIVEIPIDGNNTVKRYLVDADITDKDIVEGASILDENETAGLLVKSSRPDKLLVGDRVKSRVEDKYGHISGKLKSGKFEVRWENGESDRVEAKQVQKIH